MSFRGSGGEIKSERVGDVSTFGHTFPLCVTRGLLCGGNWILPVFGLGFVSVMFYGFWSVRLRLRLFVIFYMGFRPLII